MKEIRKAMRRAKDAVVLGALAAPRGAHHAPGASRNLPMGRSTSCTWDAAALRAALRATGGQWALSVRIAAAAMRLAERAGAVGASRFWGRRTVLVRVPVEQVRAAEA